MIPHRIQQPVIETGGFTAGVSPAVRMRSFQLRIFHDLAELIIQSAPTLWTFFGGSGGCGYRRCRSQNITHCLANQTA